MAQLRFFGVPSTSKEDLLSTSARATLLLSSLANSDDPVPRDTLLKRLWPEINDHVPSGRSTANLDNCVSEARAAIKDLGLAIRASKSTHTLVLVPIDDESSTESVSDLAVMRRAAQSEDKIKIERSLGLVRGPVLASFNANQFPWVAEVRRKYARRCVKLVKQLTGWPEAEATIVVTSFFEDPDGTLLEAAQVPAEGGLFVAESVPMEHLLVSKYGDGAPALQTLARLVIPDSTPFFETDITLKLADGGAADSYQLEYSIETTANLDRFVVAVTNRSSLTDLLLAECPELSDSFTCSSSQSRRAFVAKVNTEDSPVSLWCLDPSPRGSTKKKLLEFRTDLKSVRAQVLGDLSSDDREDITILSANLPGQAGAKRRIGCTYRDREMSLADHYAFWKADRPTYVRRISLDAEHFAPEIRIHPMIGNIGQEIRWDGTRCDLTVENWLVKNQGIFLIW